MTEVGRLVEGVLSVKYKRKWKKKLCILEKLATFTNSLKLSVLDQESSDCCIEDVVHAFISFLEPNRHGTLMLVCNYKVRCLSFDHFEELNRWAGVLKAYLTCNYFHADLILASKESKLSSHAKSRRWRNRGLLSHRRSQHNLTSANGTGFFQSLSNNSGDGYLHVTRDRICFTTVPGCAHPRLLATWSFDNDELVQCGTARFKPRTECGPLSDHDRATLFFLTASPSHPDAPGCHLFLSDRATELCEWIETNNQSAIYQAEWRRLTSIAAVLDTPFATASASSSRACNVDQTISDNHVHVTPFNVVHTAQLGTPIPSTQCCQCSLASQYHSLEKIEAEEVDNYSLTQPGDDTSTELPRRSNQCHPQLIELLHETENPESMTSSVYDQSCRPGPIAAQPNTEPIPTHSENPGLSSTQAPSDATDNEDKLPCRSSFAQAEFEKRK